LGISKGFPFNAARFETMHTIGHGLGPTGRFLRAALLAWAAAAAGASSPRAADLDVFPLHSQARVALLHGQHIFVEVLEGRLDVYLRPGSPVPEGGAPMRIEWERLSPAVQAMALRRVFPGDTVLPGEWVHRVAYADGHRGGEGLAQVAAWFTGRAENAAELARLNALGPGPLRDGQIVRIPRRLLLAPLAEAVPAAAGGPVLVAAPSAPQAGAAA
jgi:hypothetical protein